MAAFQEIEMPPATLACDYQEKHDNQTSVTTGQMDKQTGRQLLDIVIPMWSYAWPHNN